MPEIKKSKKYKAICIPLLEGENEKGLDYLKKWARVKDVEIKDIAICVYYDSPLLLPPERCRRDVCIIFDGKASEDGKVKIKKFPEQKIASFSFNGEIRKACAEFFKWLAKNGYKRMTPLREVEWNRRKELQIGIKDNIN
ncbi:MAG: GyrI-like domain-containing protein [Thermoplasmata archaeon]|nr:MAG: GyrI-like domain-containing protein [Thermoplasmata archaeon]